LTLLQRTKIESLETCCADEVAELIFAPFAPFAPFVVPFSPGDAPSAAA
jgi:hypothetical protein